MLARQECGNGAFAFECRGPSANLNRCPNSSNFDSGEQCSNINAKGVD